MGWFDDMFNPSGPYRQQLAGGPGSVAGLAKTNAGLGDAFGMQQESFANQDQASLSAQRAYLMNQMNGQNSVSAEQLRQGLQQNLASQQSMAAGANPNDAAMASRNAAMNMGNASTAMAGQQALAGLQERNQAAQNLSQLNLGALGTNVSGALGGLNASTSALGTAGNAYGAAMGNPGTTPGGTLLNTAMGVGGALLMSDKDSKTSMRSGDAAARKTVDALSAVSYKYKDPKNGKGQRLGITAQDLAKNPGTKAAVVDTPRGKMVDTAQLSATTAALVASLGKRVKKLEGKGKS